MPCPHDASAYERVARAQHARARARRLLLWLVVTLGSLAVVAPGAVALNFTVNQNAELQVGAPAGAGQWTSKAFHSATNMSYGMYYPDGVAVDSSGSVYVADTESNRVMRWAAAPTTDGQAMTNIIMKADASQASWHGACTGNASAPEQLMSYGTGSLAVADRGNSRIVFFTSEPTTDGAMGTVFLGQANGSSCSPNRGSTADANTLRGPSAAWTDGTKVAVADTQNNRVLIWDSFPATGQAADRVLGQADFTSTDADRGGAAAGNTLDHPKGVWFDGTWLYVADSNNHRVLAWNGWPASDSAATHVIGQPDMTTTTTSCNNRKLNYPVAVTATAVPSHRLAISVEGNSRIVVLNEWPTTPTSNPVFSSALGQSDLGTCAGRNRGLAAASAATLNDPGGVAFDTSGRLWVADVDNHRVLRYPSLANGTSADRVLGQTTFASNVPMNGVNGNVFRMLNSSSNAAALGTRVAMAPNGLLVAPEPSESAIRIWTSAPSTSNEAFSIRYGQGARDRSGINGPGAILSASSLRDPHGAWTDGTKLLVADTANERVLVWTTMPTTDTDAPDYVLGQPNFTTATRSTTQTGVDKPVGVASDGIDVFVADRDNDRVLIYRNYWLTPSNGKPADVVLGQSNFTSGSSGLAQNRLDRPLSVSVDSRRRLVVADLGNHRVLVWNDHTTVTNGQNADAVIGQTSFTAKATGTITEDTNDVQLAGGGLLWTQDCYVGYLDPLPTSGSVMTASGQVGNGCAAFTTGQNRMDSPSSVTAAASKVWVANSQHARLMRWADGTAPTITAAPTATVRCDGTVTISWTTSESTTTEIRWDTVSRTSWTDGYANESIDTTFTGLAHSHDLSFATPGTKYVRVRAEDWAGLSVESAQISFVVPATCPAPTTMFGDDVNAQGGAARANPSVTNAPPINSTAFHTSWVNAAGVTMDRRETGTWSTPPEHAGGVWHMDSSNAADPNGQSTNAITWSGGQPYTTGRFGNAATFTADTQYGTIADHDELTKSNDFTFDLWFNSTSIANDAFPVMAIKSNGSCGITQVCNYSLEWDRGANVICGAFMNTSNIEVQACRTATGLLDGEWHHAAMTVSSTNAIRLYVDGTLAAGPIASPMAARTSTDPITIGRSTNGLHHFRGSVDEVRFSPVAYDDAAILGYYRTKRPHLDQLDTQPSTALGTNCTTATRCEDQTYAGVPNFLREGARYWQRTRFNTLNNDYWTNWGVDWLETTTTSSINVTVGGTVDFGTGLPGADAYGSSSVQVTTNSASGYQLLARDESDTWGLERVGGGPTILDRQNGVVAPATWPAGTSGFYGMTVRSATGNRLAKWGTPPGGFAENDVTNNLYTGLEGTSDVLLHERLTYGTGTDTVVVTWRVNPGGGQAPGNYDGVMTMTAVAAP